MDRALPETTHCCSKGTVVRSALLPYGGAQGREASGQRHPKDEMPSQGAWFASC